MKEEYSGKNSIRQMAEGRAARVCAVAVSVFLCVFTLLEFTALYLEWEIPVLSVVSGENSFWSQEYQREELALDGSLENELLEMTERFPAGDDVRIADDSGAMEQGIAADGDDAPADIPEKSSVSEIGTEVPDDSAPEFPYYIRINRKQNCITVYTLDEDGGYTEPCRAMVCSTGLYNATPRGTFQISTKYRWRELYGGVYGQYATRIHGGVLFHSVPYYRKDEGTLCTDKYNKLGQQASMGCVRLTVEDAKWIAENCPVGTTVEIYDDDDPGPLGKPDTLKLDFDSPNRGWDPTDPNENNPWREMSEDF